MTITLPIMLGALLYYGFGVWYLRRKWRPSDDLGGAVTLLNAWIWPMWALGSLIAK